MLGHRPSIKLKAKALVNRQKIMELIGAGQSVMATARQVGMTVQSVRRHLRKALATESLYPGSLSAEEVAQLRQVQAEVLSNSRQKAIQTHTAVADRIGTPAEKNMDATASARLLEAVVRSIDLEAALFGTKQPTKVIEEQTRRSLNVNIHQTEKGTMLTWDRSILTKRVGPVPGLTIYEGCRTNGVASAAPSLGNDNGAVADASTNAVLDDPGNNGNTAN
jgi:hypothetical protein